MTKLTECTYESF